MILDQTLIEVQPLIMPGRSGKSLLGIEQLLGEKTSLRPRKYAIRHGLPSCRGHVRGRKKTEFTMFSEKALNGIKELNQDARNNAPISFPQGAIGGQELQLGVFPRIFRHFLYSASTVIEMPPRTAKSAVTLHHRGFSTETRSSRITLVTCS
jgi:hypothetical protein